MTKCPLRPLRGEVAHSVMTGILSPPPSRPSASCLHGVDFFAHSRRYLVHHFLSAGAKLQPLSFHRASVSGATARPPMPHNGCHTHPPHGIRRVRAVVVVVKVLAGGIGMTDTKETEARSCGPKAPPNGHPPFRYIAALLHSNGRSHIAAML
jgi:hypothetical protein